MGNTPPPSKDPLQKQIDECSSLIQSIQTELSHQMINRKIHKRSLIEQIRVSKEMSLKQEPKNKAFDQPGNSMDDEKKGNLKIAEMNQTQRNLLQIELDKVNRIIIEIRKMRAYIKKKRDNIETVAQLSTQKSQKDIQTVTNIINITKYIHEQFYIHKLNKQVINKEGHSLKEIDIDSYEIIVSEDEDDSQSIQNKQISLATKETQQDQQRFAKTNFLKEIIKQKKGSQGQILKTENIYRKIQDQDIKYFKKEAEAVLSKTMYRLQLQHTDFSKKLFSTFCSMNWNNLEVLMIYSSGVTSSQWRQFINSSHNFANLKVLWIYDNKIEEVQDGDLERLHHLKQISFCYQSFINPLTPRSIRTLSNFFTKNIARVKVEYKKADSMFQDQDEEDIEYE